MKSPAPDTVAKAVPAAARCANCSTAFTGRFCPACGQEDRPLEEPFRQLVGSFLAGAFDWDSRTLRTVRQLLLPGRLTVEYNAGRRASYLPPARVYLIASFLFLLAITLAGGNIAVSVSLPESGAGPALRGTLLEPLGARLERGVARGEAEPEWLRERWFRAFAWSMFLAMPLFALQLAMLEFRRRRPYAHHLVFAVHFHAYAFLMLAAAVAIGHFMGASALVLTAALPVYLALALRRVYGGGLMPATLRAGVLILLHLVVVILLALVATALILVLAG